MQDWIKRTFSEPQTIGIIVSSALIGAIAGLAKGVIEQRHGGWAGFVRAVLTGVAVAIIVGLGLEGLIESETARLAIVGASAVISEDIWASLKSIGGNLRQDPLAFLARLLDAARGRNAAGRPPAPVDAHERKDKDTP